jgi:hypothetical protein
MGGEKFDSPQPESFLFGENSGKYPQRVPLNIWPFFSLAYGQRIIVATKSEVLLFPPRIYSWRKIIVMNYGSLSFNESFCCIKKFSSEKFDKIGTA